MPSTNSSSPPSWLGSAHFFESKLFWLALYFSFNLSLTLHNKAVLMRFPFPYTLTALHTLCGFVGGYILLETGAFRPARLLPGDTAALAAFSVLYAVNVVVSNISLQLVTVPFHQVVRAMTPLFTVFFTTTLLGFRSTRARVISLVPVVAGVALATYGDYDFTFLGFLITILGAILAALKTIFTNVVQSSSPGEYIRRLRLHPVDLLVRMSPLAFIQCLLYAQLSGELTSVRHYIVHELTVRRTLALVVNGILSFALNVISFSANRRTGPLSMTVAANIKQVFAVLLSVVMFDVTISWTNGLGIVLTMVGGIWYALVDHGEAP